MDDNREDCEDVTTTEAISTTAQQLEAMLAEAKGG